jgi:nicotinamide riboside kinase
MEKTVERTGSEPKRIIFTGPESTGKTMLSCEMATRYNSPVIPEYARDYVLNLKKPYTYEDVLHIAEMQVKQMKEFSERQSAFLFVDTYLIITKVWFDVVFRQIPSWLDDEIRKTRDCLYLLCYPDIPWEADPVRENGGEMRHVLFAQYEDELIKAGLNFKIVKGLGEVRIVCAMEHINNFYR